MLVAAVGLAIAGTALFIGREPVDHAPSQVLVDEDFEGQGPYGFVEEEDSFIQLKVSDGAYDILIKDASLGQPITHTFVDEFEAISFEATVTQTTRDGFATLFSPGCWDGTTVYGLTLTPDRRLLLSKVEANPGVRGRLVPLEGPIHHPALRAAGQANTVRIDCAGASANHSAFISGWVNGTPILTAEVPDGPTSFDRVGFFVETFGDETEFRVDDVTALASRDSPPTVVPPDDLSWGSTPQRFERLGTGFSFPPDWVILNGKAPDSFSVGPRAGIDWVKLTVHPKPFSVTGPDALAHHVRDAKEFLQDLGGRIVAGPTPVEIAGLPAYQVRVHEIRLVGGQTVDGELLLIFHRDAVFLLICQYEPSAKADVLDAWNLAKATFHVEGVD